MRNKLILWTFFIIFCMSIVVAASPSSPYMVVGTQKINGGIASNMQVKITAENGVSVNQISHKDTGRWMINLKDLDPSLGSSFDVTYCIADTRCKEDTQTFTVEGFDKWIEMNAPLYTGTKVTHPVYGIIKIDGVLQTSGIITVKDITTGITKDYELDSDGFQFNMIDFAYDTGDEVSISFSSFSSLFIVSGDTNVLDLSFSSSVPSTPDGSSGGDSGSTPNREGVITPEDKKDTPDDLPDDKPEEKDDDKLPEPPIPEPVKRNWLWITLSLIAVISAIGYYIFKKKE